MSNKKINKYSGSIWQYKTAEYLAYFSVLIIPLFFSTIHSSIFTIPKILVMHLISLLMVAFYLWGNYKEESFKIRLSFLNIALLFFAFILTISSLFGIDPINSFFGWNDVMPLVTIYALIIFSLVLGSLIGKKKNILINILSISLLTSVIVTLIFYFESSGGNIYLKDGSTIGNNSYLGCYLLFNFFFGLALFLYQKKLWKKIFISLASIFILINPIFVNKDFLLGKLNFGQIISHPISLLGMANGATMGIGLSSIFIILLFLISSKKKPLRIAGLSFLIIFISGIIFVGRELITPNTGLNRLYIEEKSGNRFLAWDIAKKGFSENPILGNGFNNYIYTFDKYYDIDFYKSGYFVENFTYPHNVIYEFASNNGVLGLLGYLGLLAISLFTLVDVGKDEEKRTKCVRIVLGGIILGYFIQNLFVFDTICTYLMLFVVVSAGLGFSKYKEINISNKYINVKKSLIIILIISSIVLILPMVINPWEESLKIDKMIMSGDMKKFTSLRSGIQKTSLFGGMMEDAYIDDKLSNVYRNELPEITDKNKPIFLKEINSMSEELEKDINKQPYYSNSYFVLSKVLNVGLFAGMKSGDYIKLNGGYDKDMWNKSFNSVNKGIELNPNTPPAYLLLSQLYFISNDSNNAILYCKKSIEMAPEYKEAYTFADSLIGIYHDKNFENYIKGMKSKWLKTN